MDQELLAEAALILEQEGWLIGRAAHEMQGRRLEGAFERYQSWQKKVDEYRKQNPGMWPEPSDNS